MINLVITYDHIFHYGQLYYENTLYKHIYFPEMPLYYSGNFIQFKVMPTLEEFIQAVEYLKDFHKKHGQNHVQFYFPPNQKPIREIMVYLWKEQFSCSFTELYGIRPAQFKYRPIDSNILVTPIDEKTFPDYLTIQYHFDSQFGEDFAKQKAMKIHQRNFHDPAIMQLLAFFKGEPAGTVDCIIREDTVEIDQLQVLEQYQKKGIGTALQKYVMDHFPNQWVILVAEGEDTPREMYQKQNYQYYGLRYEAVKIFN